MIPKEAIERLWQEGFFERHRKGNNVKSKAFSKYGCT